MNDYWPAFLVNPALENPHAIFVFRAILQKTPHIHVHRFHEFFYLLSEAGSQRMEGQTVDLAPGDLHFLPANSWHIAEGAGTAEAIVLNFYDTAFAQSLPADREARVILQRLGARARGGVSGIPLTENARARVASLLIEMADESERHPPCWESALKIRLHALLILIARETLAIDTLPNPSALRFRDEHTVQIEKVLAYIQEHMAERLSLNELCRIAGMGHSLFCEAFKACTGHTLVDYINRMRIDRACFLLSREPRPLPIIAETCGFRSFSRFYAVFRSLTGRTPRQFRLSAMSRRQ